MLDDSRIQYGLLVGGLVLAILAILIDPIRGYSIYLAPVQIVALVVGILVFLVGAYVLFIRKPPPVM